MTCNQLLFSIFSVLSWFIASTVGRVAIIGGEKADDDQFPYQVSLMTLDVDYCGGAILSDQHVLTAAHCVLQVDGHFIKDRIFVLAGTNNLHKLGHPAVNVEVKKVYVPTEFKRRSNNNVADIALLKLKQRLQLSKHVTALRLPKTKYANFGGKTADIAGFGWNNIVGRDDYEVGQNTDYHLRYAKVEILMECRKKFYVHTVSDKQICARVKDDLRFSKRGVCTGDSGGVLVYDNTAIGILSTSPSGCDETNSAAVYTRVANYLDFIHNAIDNKKHDGIRSYIFW